MGLFNVKPTASITDLEPLDDPVWNKPFNNSNNMHWVLFAKGPDIEKIRCFKSSPGNFSPGLNVITRVALMNPSMKNSNKIDIMPCSLKNRKMYFFVLLGPVSSLEHIGAACSPHPSKPFSLS